MTSTLAAPSELVNPPLGALGVDSASHPWHPLHVERVGDRIQWILDNRGFSARSLSVAAGLSHSSVGFILRNFRSKPDAGVEVDTLKAIAGAAKVSERWLLLGEGSPLGEDLLPPSTAPNDAPPLVSSIPGWPESRRIAKGLRADLPDAALDKAEASARLLTTAHATPELVIQLAELALRFAGPDLLEQLRAEGVARTVRARDAYDAMHEHGMPLPPDVRREGETLPHGRVHHRGMMFKVRADLPLERRAVARAVEGPLQQGEVRPSP